MVRGGGGGVLLRVSTLFSMTPPAHSSMWACLVGWWSCSGQNRRMVNSSCIVRINHDTYIKEIEFPGPWLVREEEKQYTLGHQRRLSPRMNFASLKGHHNGVE
ncbi:hypothetical protein F4778DRAFT_402844 [Xylariomycetidae sp. FL2044]|nr:hypothetical protein F4778DRAFT_402844 [Xylariomycetidae sp. FL2044]